MTRSSVKPDAQKLLCQIRAEGSDEWLAKMAGFGIETSRAVGVSVTRLRQLRRGMARDNAAAFELWNSGVHEARLLATTLFEPDELERKDVERLVCALDSWDICDMACNEVFRKVPFAVELPWEWAERSEEYVRRAGYALVATFALRGMEFDYASFFSAIRLGASDERKMVHKAVNWSLRQIGKRSDELWGKAVECARELSHSDGRSARWVGRNAIWQLSSPKWRPVCA
ncbi:MAG: DNA alkylation repair protein [Planctomycetota bacterium]|nr:DNA alkylation repair protein [Planctomycetota bacterium]